ncbi:MAG: efflux RND transporter permease subunit [Planctomycetes bacterium]|nr:efflux RND transporter permease subunit [Planctomycetota bacterium]
MAWATRLVRAFIDSPLTPLILFFSVLVGAGAVILLPREEEPQIQVPMIDVFVRMDGASPQEVEQRVTKPMEQFLWEIPGVEYVYSTSSTGNALVVVRFEVGHDQDAAVVAVERKLATHFDRIPPGVVGPLIKPHSIDEVAVLTLTLWSPERDHHELRLLAGEIADALKAVPDVAQTGLVGGRRREVRVSLDAAALAAHGIAPQDVLDRLAAANRRGTSGALGTLDAVVPLEAGGFLVTADDVRQVVVGASGGRPVHVADVADVVDGPDEIDDYVLFEPGPALAAADERGLAFDLPAADDAPGPYPAVTLSVAKRPGTNAVVVVGDVLSTIEALRPYKLPRDVRLTVTRNYGQTAAEKSDELLLHMGIAVISVALLIWIVLGWREAGIVAIAIPVTLALTLAVFLLLGYTLNRITLFALIFSIGILVDDPIVDVENIVRHVRMAKNRGRSLLAVTVEAVNEVRSPLILATLTVISAVLPMAFVRGLMGPYMRPIPVGASTAMFVSMAVAFVITPWAARHLLRGEQRHAEEDAAAADALAGGAAAAAESAGGVHADGVPASAVHVVHDEHEHGPDDAATRLYRRGMAYLLASRGRSLVFMLGITGLLLAACALVPLGLVRVKMLPFDDKSEFQVVLDMPEGTPLETTANVAREIAAAVRAEPEVTDVQVYAGCAAPFNFNGLVRHWFLRGEPQQADVQVNLVGKHQRDAGSHAFVGRVRPRIAEIAARHGARVAVAEVPPGPPVLQTLVAEVYHPDPARRLEIARGVRDLLEATPDVVDVDWMVEDEHPRERLVVDEEKAALHGVAVEDVRRTVALAVGGAHAGLLHDDDASEDVDTVVRLPRDARATSEDVLGLRVRARGMPDAPLVPLRELVRVERDTAPISIHHKNLLPVVYVTADVAGREESPIYPVFAVEDAIQKLDPNGVAIRWLDAPYGEPGAALKWDGELHVTMEVFRDLGLAFAAVLLLIYVLVVGWFRSFATPLLIMAAIPFSLVGILPAHAAMGAFFTATSMIGFIAGAGIVVRNSIILVDFIELRRGQGVPLEQAVIDAGAIRFRPMVLTAMAVIVGAGVILFDPIFQGLAISLMAGEVASLLLSRAAVPVLYDLWNRGRA